MLTERRAQILGLIVSDYVETAVPVASQTIARKHKLGVSPATIRNEMARLEEDGYITHPHTSAGRIPSDRGYRYYVETLMEEEDLPWEVKETVRHQFHQAYPDLEEWVHLAAAVLARLVRNAAVVTAPRAARAQLKHLELVSLRDFLALLVVVLEEALLRQQVITFAEPVSQDELATMAGRLNAMFGSLSLTEIGERSVALTPAEQAVMDAVSDIMSATESGSEDACLDGVRYILSQPEFARSDRMLEIVELLDERNLSRLIPFGTLAGEGVTIIIGSESRRVLPQRPPDAIGQCSVVVTTYGSPGTGRGAVAVLGPTRMRYPLTISTVRYLSELMSELMSSYRN